MRNYYQYCASATMPKYTQLQIRVLIIRLYIREIKVSRDIATLLSIGKSTVNRIKNGNVQILTDKSPPEGREKSQNS